ncbi:MAG TPA: cation:proton antiporter [Xanthobacteraceae bacterium]|nr:cation:proton antiporter [Xanthobacteraceae bacterium]
MISFTISNQRLRGGARLAGCLAALVLLGCGPAFAADGPKGSEALFLAQLVVLMAAGRLLGEGMQRLGQPAVMGQLLAGVILGPSVFGALWPQGQHALFLDAQAQKSMLDAISQFGILLLLLLTGMETDLKLVRKVGSAAVSVALAGVAVPFALGVALGEFLPDALLPRPDQRLLTALFLGTALSISSIKIVAAIVRDMNFSRRDLGQIIISSAILEDTIGWIIIAVTLSLAQAGNIDLKSVARSVAGTAAFLAFSLTLGRRLVVLLIRWSNDYFESEFAVITTILVIMGVMALVTDGIGVNTVLGAFVAGVLVGDSPILTGHIDEQLRGLITAFFMPVFFALAGLSTDMRILADRELLLLALGLIAIASVGKFAGAFVGGKLGGLRWREAFALGCGMNARGSTEVIVATIGLSMGALSQKLFSMIVAMAITTTMAMPPMLRFALARVPMRRAERERLAREEMEAKGFVPKLERLLLAVDQSQNGKFAARIAGLVAGQRGIPITVLSLTSEDDTTKPGERGRKAAGEDTAKETADDTKNSQPKEDRAETVDVTVRTLEAPTHEAIAQEAERGYDLMLVGLERMRGRDAFHDEVDRIAAAFDGPLAIVAGAGLHLDNPEDSPLDMLVPVNGTDVSRRAAEIAVEVARGATAKVTALYVATRTGRRGRSGRLRREEQAILDDVTELARLYGRKIATAVRTDVAPDDAVLTAAKRHNLIVMGVSRRPGDKLFFGETAAGVFREAPISVVFVAS